MARLSRPADFSHSPIVADRPIASSSVASPILTTSPLRSIPVKASPRSHGNENLSPSPTCEGSGPLSLSPAGCRTLKKTLSDVESLTAPSSLTSTQSGELPFPNTDNAGNTEDDNLGGGDSRYQLVAEEATDAGYEDEDDSMELSDSAEDRIDTAVNSAVVSYGHKSTSTSQHRRLQDSVSIHDEMEKLKYSDRRLSYVGAKRLERKHRVLEKDGWPDTMEDVMNLPGSHAPPARPQNLRQHDSDQSTISDDIKHLNQLRLSMEKVLEDERVAHERAERKQESGVFIASLDASQGSDKVLKKSHIERFDTNNDKNLLVMSEDRYPTHNGADPARCKPSRDTVISQEIATVATEATSIPESLSLRHIDNAGDSPKDSTEGHVPSTGSAVDDLMFLQKDFAPPNLCEDLLFERFSQEKVGTHYQANLEHSMPDGANPGSKPAVAVVSDNKIRCVPDSTVDDARKQIILYPQHPAFVNVIGMIPATMFWLTAAPVVKYTHIAIDMLIDKLRDTYL
ncbi:hypothetical protein N0V94_002633 [Neodidymelliopsis sp. IMI 364377]|nr:hypothetical protein N0V94_002633 [Neodidymelliopsis sp. IMI 364377]